jgi:hypothetical protein
MALPDPMKLPPNTYDMTVMVRVTLPPGQTPEVQDMALCLTGEDFEPWPGVMIHDAELISSTPITARA